MSSPGNIYVAIVDDDESLRRSLSRLLRAAGLQPIVYASAEDFLADEGPPRFSCLVFDIRMGGMSGIELQNSLAKAGSRTPVIFITAHEDPMVRDEAMESGCAGFFRKSDSGEFILNAIKAAVRGSRAPP